MTLDDVTEQDIRSYVKCLPPQAFEPYKVRDGIPLYRILIPQLSREERKDDGGTGVTQRQRMDNANYFFVQFERKLLLDVLEKRDRYRRGIARDCVFVGTIPGMTMKEGTRDIVERTVRRGSFVTKNSLWGKNRVRGRFRLNDAVYCAGIGFCSPVPETLIVVYKSEKLVHDRKDYDFFFLPEKPREALEAIILLEESKPIGKDNGQYQYLQSLSSR